MGVAILEEKEIQEIVRRSALLFYESIKEEIHKPAPELMTKNELADYLRCDVSKINRLMKNGLPFEKFGSSPRFRKASIDAWLQKKI
jgi:excisionase family DNA binding protein